MKTKTTKKSTAATSVSATALLTQAFGAPAAPAAAKKKTYPMAKVDAGAVDSFIKANAELTAAKAVVATARAQIEQGVDVDVATQWLRANAGRTEAQNLQASGSGDNMLLLQFKNSYPSVPRADIERAIGQDKANALFTDAFTITLRSEKIPDSKRVDLVQGLVELMTKLGINTDQSSEDAALIFKTMVKPVAEFHDKRHTALTLVENEALQGVLQPTFSISVRNQTAS